MSITKSQNGEERRSKLMEIFHQDKEFYQFKEIEKLAKEKGVVLKHLKETLQTLVDNGQVESDKIGSSMFYWSFPVPKAEELKKKGDELKAKNKILNEKLNSLNEALKEKQKEEELQTDNNNNTDDDAKEKKIKCNNLKSQIATLKNKEKDLMKFLNEHKNSIKSKVDIAKIKKDSEDLYAAANRWTDAVFEIRSYLLKNCNSIDEKTVNREFLIPDNFDYVPIE